MPRNELRTSGLLQAAVIALVLGWRLRGTPADAEPALWPYVLAGYGLLAATIPWLLGGVDRGELRWQYSLLLGVLFALPMALAAWWLDDTPYRSIRFGCWALAAAWGVHLAVGLLPASRRTG